MDVHPEMGLIPDPSLNDQASRRGLYQGGILYRGNFVVRLNYEGLEELLRGVMGSYALNQVDAGPPVVNDHDFEEASTLQPYTIEMIEGKPADANVCADLEDAIFTGMTIRGAAGGGAEAMLQADVSVLAKNKNTGQTPTGLSAPALYPVLYHQATTIDPGNGDAAADVRVRSFELAIEQPHTDDRFYLGSVNVDTPLRNDFLTVRWRFTLEYVTETIIAALKAGTVGTPKLVFQHPAIIQGAFKRELELRSETAIYTEEARPVAGYGVILQNAAMEAYNDGTGDASALHIRVRNGLPTL